MTREETLEQIDNLINRDWAADHEIVTDAVAIFERMPITLAETSGMADFNELALMAAHDLFRE